MTWASDREQLTSELGRALFGDGWRPTIASRANGRIEVIGNHVDYNGGPVVAAAIDRGLTVLAQPTSDGFTRAAFPDLGDDEPRIVDVAALRGWRATTAAEPVDYLRGVVAAALDAGLEVRSSLDLVVHGDIPVGGGVSSSAALCVALAQAVLERLIDRPSLVRLAQEAEHRAGTPCGTMDQSASVFGGIILFGGSPDEVTALPAHLGSLRFVVLGSGVQRSLAVSKYADRVEECQLALERLRGHLGKPVDHLADVTLDELNGAASASAFTDAPTLLRRARHIVTEVARVRAGLTAIHADDWSAFGELMNDSGRSSATDYDISHPVVEELVGLARHVEGVIGARMMGGGEGGNALALVESKAIDNLRQVLAERFYRPRGHEVDALMFVGEVGASASVELLDRQ